jgi:DNA-binding SARP family transcriptional activator/predicted ATPase
MNVLLRLTLLGGFRAVYADEPLRALDAPRLQSLVARLALRTGLPQQRHHLAFTFWPDSSEAQSRTNLRQLLHHLRRALPELDAFVGSDRRTLLWRPDAPATVDAVQLERAWSDSAAAAEAGEVERAITVARRAAELYQGDLLPDCYDEWIEPDRQRLCDQAVAGLNRLLELLQSRRRYGEAIPYVEKLLRIDPLRERTHALRIRLLALSGEPGLAERAYRECVELLERNTGTGPGPELRALADRLPSGPVVIRPLPGPADRTPPLIGRHAEWRSLMGAWERAGSGAPHLLLLTGEPGIGKTRLAEALLEWADRQGIRTARSRCYAAEGVLPYGPVTQWLRGGLRDRQATTPKPWRTELSRLLPELMPDQPRLDSEPGTDGAHRTRLFEAFARVTTGPGEPVLLLLDDLQWCDGDSLESIHYLLRSDPGARLLVLATMRTGETVTEPRLPLWLHQLRGAGLVTELAIAPFAAAETAELANAIAGRSIERAHLDVLHEETEGNPLFTVETVRSWIGTSPSPAGPAIREQAGGSSLPAKVHAVIQARLAQLSPGAGELIGIAAAIGRDFALPVLEAAAGAEQEVVRALDELLDRHLVREHGDGLYDFAHDRIREVAYSRLSSTRRSWIHGRIAAALESGATSVGPVSGEIAGHLERAARGSEAIPYYRRAAAHAWSVLAYREAAEHLRRALRLLEESPETAASGELELELQTALGAALVVTDHYSGKRVWETYTRAHAVCERVGRRPSAPILRGLALASLMRSRIPHVVELGRELLRAAERDADPMLEVEAHYVLGVTFYWQGQMGSANHHLQHALARYDPVRAATHLQLYTQDPSVICGVRLALTLWHLGEVERGRELCLETIARAEALAHPFSLAYARYWGLWVLIECGDMHETRRHLVALKRGVAKHRLAVWPAMASVLEGWMRAEDGDPSGGLDQMRRGAAEYRALEVSLGFPYQQGLYARACRRGGYLGEALTAVDEALAMADRTGERFWDAELHRLRGELLLDSGATVRDARTAFERSLEVAREQRARSLELRAERALARLG